MLLYTDTRAMRPHAMLRVTSLYVGGGARAPQRARAPTPDPMPQMQPAMVVNFNTPPSRLAHLTGGYNGGAPTVVGPSLENCFTTTACNCLIAACASSSGSTARLSGSEYSRSKSLDSVLCS